MFTLLGGSGWAQSTSARRNTTGNKTDEIIHSDYLSMPEGLDGLRTVLVLKDGMSGFCEFFPTTVDNTEAPINALMDWLKRYG